MYAKIRPPLTGSYLGARVPLPTRPTGRRPGRPVTREQIIAARGSLAKRRYDAIPIWAAAAEAGVDWLSLSGSSRVAGRLAGMQAGR